MWVKCDRTEDGRLFAGYCFLFYPSPVVSIIRPSRLPLSCFSLWSQGEEEKEEEDDEGREWMCSSERPPPSFSLIAEGPTTT